MPPATPRPPRRRRVRVPNQAGATPVPVIQHGFCVNLDRRVDRMAAFRSRVPASLAGLVERFSAVDGRELALTPDLTALFADNDFGFRRNIIGCHLSHYALWRLVADERYPYACTAIFEDDVVFSSRFAATWEGGMADALPADFDLAYLGGRLGPATLAEMDRAMAGHDGHLPFPVAEYAGPRVNEWFVRPRQVQFCTFSYLLSKRGARALCALVERDGFQRSVDWFMIDRWPEMNVFAATPLLCWAVFQEGSDILLDFERFRPQREGDGHA